MFAFSLPPRPASPSCERTVRNVPPVGASLCAIVTGTSSASAKGEAGVAKPVTGAAPRKAAVN